MIVLPRCLWAIHIDKLIRNEKYAIRNKSFQCYVSFFCLFNFL